MLKDASVLRPHGHVIIVGDGPVVERDTLSCVHCGGHWVVVPGSGRTRGWCMKCKGPTCGKQACCACRPVDALIYGER